MSERGHFTDRQRNILLDAVHPRRVQSLDGISHLAAWDVVAHLNRVFGFEGWDKEILTIEPVYERVGERELTKWEGPQGNRRKVKTGEMVPACSVGYRCTMRLTVRNPEGEVVRVVEDVAMGTATNQRDLGDAHDLALKSAVSYALKRCAKDLGDQFGLSLYNKGQETACVMRVFPYETDAPEGDHHVEVNVEADGISEGDDSFGDKRGDRSEPAAAPAVEGEQNPAAEVESHPEDNVPPVREPAPRREAKPKPEATPPVEPAPEPTVDEEMEKALLADIANAESVEEVKSVWKGVQATGQLDAMVFDLKTEQQMTLRELMVRRVSEIETAA